MQPRHLPDLTASPAECLWHAAIRQCIQLAAGDGGRLGYKDPERLGALQRDARRWLFARENAQRAEVCAGLGVSEGYLRELARRGGARP